LRCVKEILNYNPRVIGLSVLAANYSQALLIAAELKKRNSSIITVFGGATPTVDHEYILQNSEAVDICLRGEGEEIFASLLTVLCDSDFKFGKAALEGIGNISYKRGCNGSHL